MCQAVWCKRLIKTALQAAHFRSDFWGTRFPPSGRLGFTFQLDSPHVGLSNPDGCPPCGWPFTFLKVRRVPGTGLSFVRTHFAGGVAGASLGSAVRALGFVY
jgi:hypothetical protein